MKFDILFIDGVCPHVYDLTTLESGSLGGTESSVIRLAEGLGSLGLTVGVIQHFNFEPIAGNHCVFLPLNMITEVRSDVVVHLRSVANLHLFPNARQFVWCHDLPHEKMSAWPDAMKGYNAKIIAVSEWHKEAILKTEPKLNVIQLYSPVDEECYTMPVPKEVNTNSMIWNASPHKGLKEAVEVFSKVRKEIPNITLTVMNPGYVRTEYLRVPGVVTLGSVSRQILRQVVGNSLCLFYPTQFEETFGLIASEANALGVPVATYKIAALAESVSEKNGWFKDEASLIQGIKGWYSSRPEVVGQDRFRLRKVLTSWVSALDGRL